MNLTETVDHMAMAMEESDGEVFESYVEDLQLSSADLSKVILDVGSGKGQFAKWAAENGLNDQVYSLDPKQPSHQSGPKSVQGTAEALPFQDGEFELVVSDAAIPNIFLLESPEVVRSKVRASLLEMMRVTKPGGEIRLGRVLRGTDELQKVLGAALDSVLAELKQIHRAEITETAYPVGDVYEDVNGEPGKLLAKSSLVIIQKP